MRKLWGEEKSSFNGEFIRFDGVRSFPKPHQGAKVPVIFGGLVTTAHDPEGRPTVFSAIPKTLPRVISVGRLDINTEGLLLLTNDGELARYLEHPAQAISRTYRVRAHGIATPAALGWLPKGVNNRWD